MHTETRATQIPTHFLPLPPPPSLKTLCSGSSSISVKTSSCVLFSHGKTSSSVVPLSAFPEEALTFPEAPFLWQRLLQGPPLSLASSPAPGSHGGCCLCLPSSVLAWSLPLSAPIQPRASKMSISLGHFLTKTFVWLPTNQTPNTFEEVVTALSDLAKSQLPGLTFASSSDPSPRQSSTLCRFPFGF